MEKKEFEQKVNSIELLKNQSTPLKKEVLDNINNYLVSSVNTLISGLNERDKDFTEYLGLLKEFNFDSNLTSPTDYFPGIRTVADTVDPEELNQKTEKMKDYALNIENRNKETLTLSQNVISNLKKAISVIVELQIMENQIFDMNMDILKDLDSIYDIGDLKSATK